MSGGPLLFALEGSRPFGEQVAAALGIPLAEHEEREFEDGEHKSRPLQSVRGRDVYVLHGLYGDRQHGVDAKLVRLLLFLGALRDAGAARLTAVVPYLCYARKERRTQPRDPVTTRYIAALFEAVAVDRVVTLDVHNLAAFQNAFRCRTEHLEARQLFARHFAERLGTNALTVVSPDAGGVKRAERLRLTLEQRLQREVALAFMEKFRALGQVRGETLAGAVSGRTVLIFDDLIGSGTTIARAAAACRAQGAGPIYAAASHGLFVGDAGRVLDEAGLAGLAVTDSVPPFRLDPAARARVQVIGVAGLFAEAIRRLHQDGSLTELADWSGG